MAENHCLKKKYFAGAIKLKGKGNRKLFSLYASLQKKER
jgi:hypothetical protein